MIEINPTIADMKAAGLVANSVELVEIRLAKLATSGEAPARSPDEMVDANINFETKEWSTAETGRLMVLTSMRAILSRHEQATKRNKAGLTIEIDFISEYRTPKGPVPAEIAKKCLPAFARLNGLFNCWPYFRQELQHLTSAMGMPAFVLTPMIIRAQRPPEPGKAISPKTKPVPARRTASALRKKGE